MFGGLFRRTSKLIEGCKIAYKQGGERAVKAYIEALSKKEKTQLVEDLVYVEMDMIEQVIVSSINQSVEDTVPFKGFSEN